MNELGSVCARWRSDAEVLRRYGDRRMAAMLERCADEIEQESRKDRSVDLVEAQTLTGYTRSHLRRLMREKILPNHGTEAEPRFLVSELPRKPGYSSNRESEEVQPPAAQSRKELARSIVRGQPSGKLRPNDRRTGENDG